MHTNIGLTKIILEIKFILKNNQKTVQTGTKFTYHQLERSTGFPAIERYIQVRLVLDLLCSLAIMSLH